MKLKKFRVLLVVLLLVNLLCTAAFAQKKVPHQNFMRNELVAWCIVPFDSEKRTPEQRAAMLKELGITKLAYDWRDEHIPTFNQELDALNKNGIKLEAFWMQAGPELNNESTINTIFDFLKKRDVKTQIWLMYMPPKDFDNLTEYQKIDSASKTIANIARRAGEIGCTVGLYNHGGWFGMPETLVSIIELLKMTNIGIVYNFHHGHEQADQFPFFFPRILPHLFAVNVSGIKKDDDAILPVGAGDTELQMINTIYNSPYTGNIGIINESIHPNAKTALEMNLAGLKKLLTSIGAERAAQTYP